MTGGDTHHYTTEELCEYIEEKSATRVDITTEYLDEQFENEGKDKMKQNRARQEMNRKERRREIYKKGKGKEKKENSRREEEKVKKIRRRKRKKRLLPGGESNPGLPRDRRGYSPLYYRGHTVMTSHRLSSNQHHKNSN